MTSSTRFNLQTSNLSSECLFHHQPRCQPCAIRSLLLRVHAVVCSAFVASPVSTERSSSCDEWFVFTCTTPGCMREQPTLEVELALQMSTANKKFLALTRQSLLNAFTKIDGSIAERWSDSGLTGLSMPLPSATSSMFNNVSDVNASTRGALT
jgi:hypothetical protein